MHLEVLILSFASHLSVGDPYPPRIPMIELPRLVSTASRKAKLKFLTKKEKK